MIIESKQDLLLLLEALELATKAEQRAAETSEHWHRYRNLDRLFKTVSKELKARAGYAAE